MNEAYELPKASVATYQIPAGYIWETDDGVHLLRNVRLHEITGVEEDILASEGGTFTSKFQDVLSHCLVELSDDDGHVISAETDFGKRMLIEAPKKMLMSDLGVLMIRLRQLTVGDRMVFKTKCEDPECKAFLRRSVDISTFDIKDIDGDPLEREREFETGRGVRVQWKMMTGEMQLKAQRQAADMAKELEKMGGRKTTKAKMIAAKKKMSVTVFMSNRVKTLNGTAATYDMLRALPWSEREDIRDRFDEEGGLDTDVEVTCDCGHEFIVPMNIEAESFFSRSDE